MTVQPLNVLERKQKQIMIHFQQMAVANGFSVFGRAPDS